MLTHLGPEEQSHRWPYVLPGGKALLFAANATIGNWDNASIQVLSLHSGEVKTLVRGGFAPQYIASSSSNGYLVFIRRGVMMGAAFDLPTLALHGEPLPLVDDVASDSYGGGGQYSLARDGTLIYVRGKETSLAPRGLYWIDAGGKTSALPLPPCDLSQPEDIPGWQACGDGGGRSARPGYLCIRPRARDSATPHVHRQGKRRAGLDAGWKHIVFDSPSMKSIYWLRPDGAGQPQTLLKTQ